jgi:hypothetical protein
VSVAHYVRDAALVRLAYTAGFDDGARRLGAVSWPRGGHGLLEDSGEAVRADGARAARVQAERPRRRRRELEGR